MPSIEQQLESFHQFAAEQVGNGGSEFTLEDLVDLWRAANPADDELQDSLASLQRGLADAEAGRSYPARDALAKLRQGLPTD